jgi:hypothetical protein
MRRLAVSSAAVAGVLTLGLAGASILAPSAGAATPFVAGHAATHAPAVSSNAKVKTGSIWTLNVSGGGGCNVETFASGNVVTTDSGYTGTWIKPTSTTLALVYPNTATFVGTYSTALGDYSGKLTIGGVKYPDSTLTPGATAGC